MKVFVYDQAGQLLGEYDSTGKALREYVWLGTTPIAAFTPDPAGATNPPLVYYFEADHLDTPRQVIDQAGNFRWKWFAEPFGTNAPDTNPQSLGAYTQPLRMPGQYADQETGLSYNYFRDYDASLGRYIESDPIGLAGGVNTYAYVEDDAVNYFDREGLIRYNAPPPRTVPVDGVTFASLACLETCLQGRTKNLDLNLLVTGGAEKTGHSATSFHYKDAACDISESNPVSQTDMKACAAGCGFHGGQFEVFPQNPNRDHWHLQTTPGNGVPMINPAIDIPYVYPKN